jgi:hypothetical protein
MTNIRLLSAVLAALILLFLGAIANAAVPDIQVGAASKVINQVYGTPESTKQPRWWSQGLDVFHNETVVTAQASATRVLFRDESQLSVGPTSQVKLDDFVYNPNPRFSAVAISMAKGVFRFVGGRLSSERFNITTPAASIGLRGTVFTVLILDDGSEYIAVESGSIFVTCHQGATVTLNAGEMTYIRSIQGSPSSPLRAVPIPAVAQMDQMLQ